RAALLDKGLAAFEDLYKRYRDWMAGLTARALQGKCYEEKGDIGPALGIYNELMDHPSRDPGLRTLQRRVAYFRIVAHNKRGEFPLAVTRANDWLRAYANYRISEEGLGVQLELAKALLGQLEQLNDNDRAEALRKAGDILSQVVRVNSSAKP